MSAQPDLLSEKKAPVVLNTTHARDMLQKRYAAPEWALMQEVAPRTGGGTRYADAVSVNLWSSRGHAVHGFEIKVSRSDWLRELKQPEKAEDVFQYCDYWWILAPRGIVKDGELPPTWGLLELREGGITQIKAAPKLTPVPITIAFFASLMRRANDGIAATAELMAHRAVREKCEQAEAQVKREIEQGLRRYKELQDQIAAFTAETGIEITHYNHTSKATIELARRFEELKGYSAKDVPFSRLFDLARKLDDASALIREAVQESGLAEVERQE